MKIGVISALLSVGGYIAYSTEVSPNMSKFLETEENPEIFSEYLSFIAKYGKTK